MTLTSSYASCFSKGAQPMAVWNCDVVRTSWKDKEKGTWMWRMETTGTRCSTSFRALHPEELQSGPEIGNLVGCSAVYLELLHDLWTKGPLFSFCTEPHTWCCPSCRWMQVARSRSQVHMEKVFSSHAKDWISSWHHVPLQCIYIHADARQAHGSNVLEIIYSSSRGLDSAITPEPPTSFSVMIASQVAANCLQWSIASSDQSFKAVDFPLKH